MKKTLKYLWKTQIRLEQTKQNILFFNRMTQHHKGDSSLSNFMNLTQSW